MLSWSLEFWEYGGLIFNRQVQMYMGDRKARPGISLNSLLMEILGTAHVQALLRDELFVQLCKQTTENPRRESLLRGWELLTIALAFIPPSPVFQPALLGYLNRHRDPTFSRVFPDVNRWPIHVQVCVLGFISTWGLFWGLS